MFFKYSVNSIQCMLYKKCIMSERENNINYVLKTELFDERRVLALRFSPVGDILATAAMDGSIKLWDVSTGELKKAISGHPKAVNEIAWIKDGYSFVTASKDRTLKLWDVHRGKSLVTFTGHTEFVGSCAVNYDSILIASVSDDRTMRIWDPRTGNCVDIFKTGNTGTDMCVTFDGIGNIVTGDVDGYCKTYDMIMLRLETRVPLGDGPMTTIKYINREKKLLVGTINQSLKLWDAQNMETTIFSGRLNTCEILKPDYMVSPSGAGYVVSGSEDNCCYIWNVHTRNVVQKIAGHHSAVTCAAVHPTRDVFAITSLNEYNRGYPITLYEGSHTK